MDKSWKEKKEIRLINSSSVPPFVERGTITADKQASSFAIVQFQA